MKYYQAKHNAYDYFNKQSLVTDEIITQTERNTKCRYIMDDVFRKVEVSHMQTYTINGVRRIYDDAEVTEWKYTKDEAERAIYDKMLEIKQIVEDYCPEDEYLTMCFINGQIHFHNAYWKKHVKHKLDFFGNPNDSK